MLASESTAPVKVFPCGLLTALTHLEVSGGAENTHQDLQTFG